MAAHDLASLPFDAQVADKEGGIYSERERERERERARERERERESERERDRK